MSGGPWTRHGHPVEGVTVHGPGRPTVARCGGPGLCTVCSADAARMRAAAGQRAVGTLTECSEEVSRGGEAQPCGRPAVAVRSHPEGPYPVCAHHCRAGSDAMVPLADLPSWLGAGR